MCLLMQCAQVGDHRNCIFTGVRFLTKPAFECHAFLTTSPEGPTTLIPSSKSFHRSTSFKESHSHVELVIEDCRRGCEVVL